MKRILTLVVALMFVMGVTTVSFSADKVSGKAEAKAPAKVENKADVKTDDKAVYRKDVKAEKKCKKTHKKRGNHAKKNVKADAPAADTTK